MPGAVALARETGAPLCRWRSGVRSGSSPRSGPVDLRRGRPVRCSSARPCTSTRRPTCVRGPPRLGGDLQGMLDDLQRGRCTSRAPGEHAPWHPAHLGGACPGRRRTPGPSSRCRAARCRRPGGRRRRGSASVRRVGSLCASASRRCVSIRWCVGSSTPGVSAVSVVIGSTSTLSRRATGVAASSSATRTAAPVTSRNAVTGSRSDEAADAGVLRGLHEEAVEQVDHQARRAQGVNQRCDAGHQRQRAERQGAGHHEHAGPAGRAEPERHAEVGVAGAPVEPLLADRRRRRTWRPTNAAASRPAATTRTRGCGEPVELLAGHVRPITKNGSRPSARATSSGSPEVTPAEQADRDRERPAGAAPG